jgi:hypothetical protein
MGTVPLPIPSIEPLVARLLRAHEEGLVLSQRLLLAQSAADETETEAARAFDLAAAEPWDEELADHAIAAARASELADERELRAAAAWSAHRARIRSLLKEAQGALSSG